MSDDFQLAPCSRCEVGEMLEAAGQCGRAPRNRSTGVFRADAKRFCLRCWTSKEVLGWPLVTKLPLARAYVLAFSIARRVVPLIDIALTEGRRPGLLPKARGVAFAAERQFITTICGWDCSDEVVGPIR